MKKRIKNNKKRLIIVIAIIIIVSILLTFFLIKRHKENLIKDIKKHYNKYVITTTNTSLYDKNNKKIGTINKEYELELAKNNNTKYYKIKNTPYYIFYKDTKKIKNIKKEKNKYLVFNKNIKSSKKVVLYSNNKKVIELDKGINTPILFIKDNNYNIYYMNKILQIKKSKTIKEIEKINTQENETNHISIIHYENINENCNDYNCIKLVTAKEQLSKLKENGYYSISLNEYKDFLAGNIRLKDKAILFTTSNQNDYINNLNIELDIKIELINENVGIKFNSTNKTTNKNSDLNSIDRYQIKSYSTIENILKMANGEEVIEKEPIKISRNTSSGPGIAVLNYHFFYDPNLGETCNEGICLTVQKFREHLDYLKNNNFKTLTMNEFMKWIYGEIELPEKSVLITIDDGAMGTGKHNGNKLIPLLEEYKMHATLFLITGWWDINNYRSPYLDIQSHTNDMHQYGTCGKGQINCYSYEEVIKDLRQSINIIGNKDSFCFPFYSYSEGSLKAIKDLGFKISFVGGNRKATRNNNKFLIPRYPIHNTITLEKFKNIVN